VQTDAGPAYIKALGNAEGPHALACEWVATNLARQLGLRTFDFALLDLVEGDEVPLGHGRQAQPGPAFATRAERGEPWSGRPSELEAITNKGHLSRQIVFDSWVRNRDRYVPGRRCHVDNVFLSSATTRGVARELVTMDHTHCLSDNQQLTPRLATLAMVRDETVYGAFPAFGAFWSVEEVKAIQGCLAVIDVERLRALAASIPRQWDVDGETRAALVRFLTDRAVWLAQRPSAVFRPVESA
jgi:hypothetical protein